jgi:glycosyltransferase involved in cell wall biosynthesis
VRICYFGIYEPTSAPRDKVYFDGLKSLGVEMISCVDSAPSFWKFINLFKKHWRVRNEYDVMWVGYLSAIVVPLAKLISRKRVVFNALNSMYESIVLDQQRHSPYSFRAVAIWISDFLSFQMVDIVLVESQQQKEFVSKMFIVRKTKLHVVFTGVDGVNFYPDLNVKKLERFTAVFRGWFVNATGVEYVLETAKILKDRGEDVDFIMIGRGQRQNEIQKTILDQGLNSVKLIMEYLPADKLREAILGAHVMLGQFSPHSRMDRTIQYKTFEAMALGMPYITRDSLSNRELLTDSENCLFVKAGDAEDLADKIIQLRDNKGLRDKLSKSARTLYDSKLTSAILGRQVLNILMSVN